MNLTEILALGAGLFGIGFVWQRSRANNNEALVKNLDTKEAVAKNKGSIEAEQEKLDALSKELLDGKALEDFFNNDGNSK